MSVIIFVVSLYYKNKHMKSILNDKEYLEDLLKNSENLCDALLKAGLTATSGNYKTINKYIEEFKIDFKSSSKRKSLIIKRYSNEECFKKGSTISRHHVKKRILRESLIPYECHKCNNKGFWNNQPLILQLEHKNGINNDNTLTNLAFICPNCHSQTETYAAKNKAS